MKNSSLLSVNSIAHQHIICRDLWHFPPLLVYGRTHRVTFSTEATIDGAARVTAGATTFDDNANVAGLTTVTGGTLNITGETTHIVTTTGGVTVKGAGSLNVSGGMLNVSSGTVTNDGLTGLGDSKVQAGGVGAGQSVVVGGITGEGTTNNEGELIVRGNVEGSVDIQGADIGKVDVTAKTEDVHVSMSEDTEVTGETKLTGEGDKKLSFHISNEKNYKTDGLILSGDLVVTVGSNVEAVTGGDIIIEGTCVMNGALMGFDPAWKDGVSIEGASTGAIAAFGTEGIDGTLIVG